MLSMHTGSNLKKNFAKGAKVPNILTSENTEDTLELSLIHFNTHDDGKDDPNVTPLSLSHT